MRLDPRASIAVLAVAAAGCSAPCDLDDALTDDACTALHAMELPDTLPRSPGNAVADDESAAYLGRQIFFDARFSKNQNVRCASCHLPENDFDDGQPTSIGLATVTRNSPSVLNVAHHRVIFWDGRADSLWSQPLFAFENAREMGFSRLEIAHRIARTFTSDYEAVFGALPPLDDATRFPASGMPGEASWEAMSAADQDTINRIAANVGKAIEAYERKVAAGRAPFDRFLAGDTTALDAAARRGMVSFTQLGCADCHAGPILSDERFHNIGVPTWPGVEPDRGRIDGLPILLANPFRLGGAYADGAPAPAVPAASSQDLGAFRTPPLRNLARTAPYGHNGRFATLDEALSFHLDGGPQSPGGFVGTLDPKLLPRPVSATTQRDLEAFLDALTGDYPPPPWNDWPAKN